ncbi:MAG: uracil-DNA glycosylase [Planctomycetota bacterium]
MPQRRAPETTAPPARVVEVEPPAGTEGARGARALEAIRADYEAQKPHERFGTPHSTIVFGEGDPDARIMFVGEAPGADEDRLGRPFVGRAGQKLDQMISAMGLERPAVYIANVLKVRPPNNATPTLEEAEASAPFLYRQIDAIRPEAIVALGLPSARLLTGQQSAMRDLRGQWWPMTTPGGTETAVLPTYHPAYLLRNYTPDTRRKVWEDLKCVLERLDLPVPSSRG